MSTWHDTPPTKAGRYYLRFKDSEAETTAILKSDGTWQALHYFWLDGEWLVQFGPRIPTADELAELPGLIEEYGLRCKAYGLALQSLGSDEQWGLRKMRDEILAKINAILGVADDARAD